MRFLKYLGICLMEFISFLDTSCDFPKQAFIGFIEVAAVLSAYLVTVKFMKDWWLPIPIVLGAVVGFCLLSILVELIFFRKKKKDQ